jgi:prophage antirepressor-like protein
LERAGIDLAAAIGRTHPRELVARQDLAEQTETAPKAEAANGVAATERQAVAQIVAPTTRRNGMTAATTTDATTTVTATTDRGLLHNNRIEQFTGLDTANGLVGEDFLFRNQACRKIKEENDKASRSVS